MSDAAVTRLKIVDFSTHLSGPLAAHLLAETGADVIKVESPNGGDGNRTLTPIAEDLGLGVFHIALNGGARSIAVSTKSPNWRPVVEACTKWADAVIVGSRPKDAARRGLDFASLVAVNPELVYCQISGFGERGPWQDNTAHGQTIDGFAGSVPVDWDEDGRPHTPAGFRTSGTSLGGVFAALGLLAAVSRRDRGAGAQHVGVSLWSSALWWAWRDTVSLSTRDSMWQEYQDLGTRYRMYATSDHRAILVAPIEKKFWLAFCDLVGMPGEMRERGTWDTTRIDFGSADDYVQEGELIADRIKEYPLDHWMEKFGATEIPFGPALTVAEAMGSQHAREEQVMRDLVVRGKSVKVPASPVRLRPGVETDEDSLVPLGPPPELGEHNDNVLEDIGLKHLIGESLT